LPAGGLGTEEKKIITAAFSCASSQGILQHFHKKYRNILAL
jgi:hypothetical protein